MKAATARHNSSRPISTAGNGEWSPPLRVSFDVVFRLCERRDLRNLEWEGIFRSDRRTIESAFRKQERGQGVMLLAEANGLPAGQVWIDLTKRRKQDAALVWAMRVVPWLQGQGIGSRLLEAAGKIALSSGLSALELTVDRTNVIAQRLYRRQGFEMVGEMNEFEPYRTRAGRTVQLRRPRFQMRKLL
jgi:ribosomal protein S18 acetylase RimI-like enzyme